MQKFFESLKTQIETNPLGCIDTGAKILIGVSLYRLGTKK